MNPTCKKCNVEGVRHGSSVDCPNCGMLLAITTAPHLHDEIETLREENRKLREIVERYMQIEQDLIEDCVRMEAKLRAKSPEEYDGIYRQLRSEQATDRIDTEGMPVSFPRSYEELFGCWHALRTLHYDFEQDNDHFMAAFIETIEHGDAISALRIHELYMCFLNEDCPNREELIDERETIRKRF
ncbi:hypothetical protein [Alicyclobacillus tolerans]|uniref:Uncharacterized protein n=1 Tax=Alicyclobacillus tolerans TaxID=90970 RepID=A0A1M6YGI9_9BACL|nr:hypothetical protein [Alicyclobacillus montanus]SHL17396.1 hypothetical protein SAMN05443507_1524 [Alicyclobacillus montanus]